MMTRCRDAGLLVTPQRLAVYRALLESDDHPTPELLYSRVRQAMPSLSLATIYKALDSLTRVGVVREVSQPGSRKRYDANLERHHHLVCTRCHSIQDFYDESLDALSPSRERLAGFLPDFVSVQILGLCEGCAAEKQP